MSDPIVSDTGELVWGGWQRNQGLVTVETDRTQALIGFVKAGGRRLRNLGAQISNEFAAIVLTSLEAQPLSGTSRMLLVAGARVANTGMKWDETARRLPPRADRPP